MSPKATRRWLLSGNVQGVGFRPFVYRLAMQYAMTGWVRNNVGQVEIVAQGEQEKLTSFAIDLIEQSPMIADPTLVAVEPYASDTLTDFQIRPSGHHDKADIHLPPDYFTCPDCLAELQDPHDRRYHYPFINCTQCGPRYTLIHSLPYDREQTSMADFPLCKACATEYTDPLSRRFHAEPLACPACGPQLQFKGNAVTINETNHALTACIAALEQGQIVAIKGVGGYHLMCDASNDAAIANLRQRKARPDKPLAVMFPVQGDDELACVTDYVKLTTAEATLLRSPARPIVIAQQRDNGKSLSDLIAPKLNELGVMLAYSPLHHLLLNTIGKPLVATSANISGEPVLTHKEDVEQRLQHITSYYLHHNRPIVRPADDAVYRTVANKPRPIRLGRGYTPLEMTLPFSLDEPLLACGAQMKNTVVLAWDNRLVISPHIGELGSPRSLHIFQQTIADLQQLYQVKAKKLVCDAHPNYTASRWAKQQDYPVIAIQHHKAHASAVVLDNWQGNKNKEQEYGSKPWLVFCWDGTGYGDDQTIWGGEAFYGLPAQWQRIATMRPFRLAGGEKAAQEPWRSATALFWQTEQEWNTLNTLNALPANAHTSLLKSAWRKGINAPQSTAVGRLFDAAAAMAGVQSVASFEGQAPMLLEQLSPALQPVDSFPIRKNSAGLWQANWQPMLTEMTHNHRSQAQRAGLFHSRMAHTLIKQAELVREETNVNQIGLSGGVFQNKRLSDYVVEQLTERGFSVHMPTLLPVNDAGISAGQIMEAAMQ